MTRVLEAAHARVAICTCGEITSCYTCLRSYRNQFYHEALSRGPVADYLGRLLEQLATDPEDDRPYTLPDRASAIRAAIQDAINLNVVVDRLDAIRQAGADVLVITQSRPEAVAAMSLPLPTVCDPERAAYR